VRNLRWEVWDLPRYGSKACNITERAYSAVFRGRRIARLPVARVVREVILTLNTRTMTP